MSPRKRRLMDEEPLTKLGMRTYSVHKWELREGRIAIDFLLSRSTLALG
jgi:NADPH-dependent ferric siderophore reductase